MEATIRNGDGTESRTWLSMELWRRNDAGAASRSYITFSIYIIHHKQMNVVLLTCLSTKSSKNTREGDSEDAGPEDQEAK